MNDGPGMSDCRPLRIVAADDSAVMRRILRTVFVVHAANYGSLLPRMELVEVAGDGVEALSAIERLQPDLLLLDLEMPRMDGLNVLKRLRATAPALPVIICSAHTARGAQITLDALRCGASDYVLKPSNQTDLAAALDHLSGALLPRIAGLAGACAAAARVEGRLAAEGAFMRPAIQTAQAPRDDEQAAYECGWVSPEPEHATRAEATRAAGSMPQVVVIGVSTGGPMALEQLLPMLPADLPVPVLIVQHMPKVFTSVLAERLDKLCSLRVAEAREGEPLHAGTILIAPGDAHLEVVAAPSAGAGAAQVRLHQGPALNSCRPSVDYLFRSAARLYGGGTLALVLTGMGSDGLDGARAVVAAGGIVLAQDEASSAVWGMPGRVSRGGLAAATLPLCKLGPAIVQRVMQSRIAESAALLEGAYRREVSNGLFR